MLDMSWTRYRNRGQRDRALFRKRCPATGLHERHLFAARPEERNGASARCSRTGERRFPAGMRRTSNGALKTVDRFVLGSIAGGLILGLALVLAVFGGALSAPREPSSAAAF
jgi:hypothetical protein